MYYTMGGVAASFSTEKTPKVSFCLATVSTDDIKGQCRSYGGFHFAQVFFGCVSHMVNVYGMTKQGDFPMVYRDFLREEGIPSSLRRDQAQNEKSHDVEDIQREYLIKDEFSEAGNQQQNPVERQAIRWLKEHCRTLMDRTNCPDKGWIDALRYLADVHNILAQESLGWKNPYTRHHGYTKDISGFLHFRFRQPVFYLDADASFPASKE